jgi:hypothetical protein
MLNELELILVSSSTIIVLFLGLFVGKIMDPFFRARIFRIFTKKEWGCLGILSPDTKSVRFIVVNFNKDVVQSQGKVWILLKDRVYRHDKPERGISLTKTDLPIKWIDGIPVLYVNETTYLPINMSGDAGEVRPEEVNSVFSSWVNNQLAKALAKILSSFKNQQQLLMICAVLSLLAAGVAYIAMQNTNNIQASVDAQAKEIHLICLKTGACTAPAPAPTGGK